MKGCLSPPLDGDQMDFIVYFRKGFMATETEIESRAFMAAARRAQSESGRSLKGAKLARSQNLTIHATACDVVWSNETTLEERIALLKRFERMCRNQRMDVPPDIRLGILQELLAELRLNQWALNTSRNLVSITAYCGAVGETLLREFPIFADTPNIFMAAAESYPGDPGGFLRRVQKSVASLAADEEFAEFRDNPRIFKRAAAHYPGDPGAFLRRVQKSVASLAADEEFAAFRDTPSILRLAAVQCPGDPRAFLRNQSLTRSKIPN